MYVDLIDQISKEDKTRIENFIYKYGIKKEDFLGLDEWLKSWNFSKQKLYKLLGNNLIKSFPFEYNKTPAALASELKRLYSSHEIKDVFDDFFDFCLKKKKDYSHFLPGESIIADINCESGECFYSNKCEINIKEAAPWKDKPLQISNGMSLFKAIKRILDYYAPEFTYDKEILEDFRIKVSMILMEKEIKGELCFSIHPLDFMTMSSNSLNWSSCMSWVTDGCYKVGTLEMMNSNNVICCYLKSSIPYVFNEEHKDDPLYIWNNKKWRSLIYITKDILMAGKSYPYKDESLSKIILDYAKNLAKENLHFNYQFGPELYRDMSNIGSVVDFYELSYDNQFSKKKKIILNTDGMYNDLYNNIQYPFWCYRNPVRHNKIISLSGKSVCLKCGNSITSNHLDDADDYNERYENANNLVCEDCFEEYRCHFCTGNPMKDYYDISVAKSYETSTIHICKECYNKFVKICPCCGEPFVLGYYSSDMLPYDQVIWYYNHNDELSIKKHIEDICPSNFTTCFEGSYDSFYKYVTEHLKRDFYKEKLFMCNKCYKQYYMNTTKVQKIEIERSPRVTFSGRTIELAPLVYYFLPDTEDAQRFRYINLKAPSEVPKVVSINYCDL